MKTPWIALILKLVQEAFGSNRDRRMNTIPNIMNRIAKPMLLLFFIFLFNCAHITAQVYANTSTIAVDFNNEQGQVNKKVFGDITPAYDPSTYENWNGASTYTGFKDFGAGIWNPGYTGVKGTVQEMINLAKGAGSSVLRFPGGTGGNYYNWHDAIGPNRTHFLYGIDEWLETCRQVGAEPIYTLAYYLGNQYTDADLVEYLN